jgi:hypothetical protein
MLKVIFLPYLRDFSQNLRDANATSVEFLNTEADTGLMFAGIALESDTEEKMARNRANARKAYDTILRFIGRVSLTAAESEGLGTKMARLKLGLQTLGESF